jgi:hypothetical protein
MTRDPDVTCLRRLAGLVPSPLKKRLVRLSNRGTYHRPYVQSGLHLMCWHRRSTFRLLSFRRVATLRSLFLTWMHAGSGCHAGRQTERTVEDGIATSIGTFNTPLPPWGGLEAIEQRRRASKLCTKFQETMVILIALFPSGASTDLRAKLRPFA